MQTFYSWIRGKNTQQWQNTIGADNAEEESADFDSFFDDRFVSSSAPIINSNENDFKFLKEKSFYYRSSTKTPRRVNSVANRRKTFKGRTNEFNSKPDINVNYFTQKTGSDEGKAKLDLPATTSRSVSFKKSFRGLKKRLTPKKKKNYEEIKAETSGKEQIFQKQTEQKPTEKKPTKQHEKPKREIVSIFVSKPLPEYQATNESLTSVNQFELSSTQNKESIDKVKNVDTQNLSDIRKDSTNSIYEEKEKKQRKTSISSIASNNELEKRQNENDVLFLIGCQPMRKFLSVTLCDSASSSTTLINNKQTEFLDVKPAFYNNAVSTNLKILQNDNVEVMREPIENCNNSKKAIFCEENTKIMTKTINKSNDLQTFFDDKIYQEVVCEKIECLNENTFQAELSFLITPQPISASTVSVFNEKKLNGLTQDIAPTPPTISNTAVEQSTTINTQQKFPSDKVPNSAFLALVGDATTVIPTVASNMPVDDTNIVGSEMPKIVSTESRRLRFTLPQISITSVDDVSKLVKLNSTLSTMTQSMTATSSNDHILKNNSNFDSAVPATSMDLKKHNSCRLHHQPMSVSMTGTLNQLPTTLPRQNSINRRRVSLAARRQSNVQLAQKVVGRRTSTTLIPLTGAQIHLIRALWRQVFLTTGPTAIGQNVMHRLFFKCPKLKEIFRIYSLPPQFSNHDYFTKHYCKTVGDIVDKVVENLEVLQNIEADLEEVGRLHARHMSGQLTSKIWNSVAETFIDCTLEWGDKRCRSETVRKAWALIVAFAIKKIKHGHLEEEKKQTTIALLENCSITQS